MRFRQHMGQKDFWKRPEQERQVCINALTFVYLNLDNEDGSRPTAQQLETWAAVFEAALMEYNRRGLFAEHRI